MTRIYEDFPELLDSDPSKAEDRSELIQRLTKERLEAYEREDILKLARLTGQTIDDTLPMPMFREAACYLLDSIAVWRANAMTTFFYSEAGYTNHHALDLGDGYKLYHKNAYSNPIALNNVRYSLRYKKILDQACRVVDWLCDADVINLEIDIYDYIRPLTISYIWGKCINVDWFKELDSESLIPMLDALPDDIYDLFVLKQLMSCESGGSYRLMEAVSMSNHFTDVLARRFAESPSVECRKAAANSCWPSVFDDLSNDESSDVRQELASNPACPVSIQEKLVNTYKDGNDEYELEACNVLRECDMNNPVFNSLAGKSDYVDECILLNPTTSDELYASIADKKASATPHIDLALINCDRTSVEVLEKIKPDDYNALYFASNSNITDYKFEEIFECITDYYEAVKDKNNCWPSSSRRLIDVGNVFEALLLNPSIPSNLKDRIIDYGIKEDMDSFLHTINHEDLFDTKDYKLSPEQKNRIAEYLAKRV